MLNIQAEYRSSSPQEKTQSRPVVILEFFMSEARGAQFLAVRDDGEFIIAPIRCFKIVTPMDLGKVGAE